MKKSLLLVFVAILFMIDSASAQTIHVINFCNTLDPDIGCEVDYARTKQEAGLIAAYLNYSIRFYNGEGNACSKENLMNTLNSLKCNKNDIVLFYYSGHGTRSHQDKSEFPQMCLKYNSAYDEGKFVSLQTVIDKLQTKEARFTLVMADCCNNPVSGVSPKSLMSKDGSSLVYNEAVARNYRKLFLEPQGMVILTGCKKGQYSLGGKKWGGLLSDQFFGNGLYSAAKGDIPATWNSVLQNTYELVKNLAKSANSVQEPYYEIRLKQNPTPPPSAPSPTQPPTSIATTSPSPTSTSVIAAEPGFANELGALLDDSRSEDWRISQVSYLADKYFTSDSKVITVGRNGTTILEHESARLFLRRLATSGQISKINVVNEKTDSAGKHSYIKVQEIRKSKKS